MHSLRTQLSLFGVLLAALCASLAIVMVVLYRSNRAKAACTLGIHRQLLYRKIAQHGLE